VPAGVPGELWLGGNGIAGGYLGDPERTAASFRTVELDERGPMRLYRTGDLARWDARGTLHLCGRAPGLHAGRGHRAASTQIERAIDRDPEGELYEGEEWIP